MKTYCNVAQYLLLSPFNTAPEKLSFNGELFAPQWVYTNKRGMKNNDETYTAFTDKVNMSPSEIEAWLQTEESKSVGQDSGDGESIGHKSGEKIIAIKKKHKENLSEGDYEHMQKVVSYISRHSAQRPDGNIEETPWHYSLKNWGYDATKA